MARNQTQGNSYTLTDKKIIGLLASAVVLVGGCIINLLLFVYIADRGDVEDLEHRLDALVEWKALHLKWGHESLKADERRFSRLETKMDRCQQYIKDDSARHWGHTK